MRTTRISGSETHSNRFVFLFAFMHFSHLQARVALYTGGSEDFSIFFNSTNSDNINWFSETRVTDSPWTDLNTEPHYRFSIEGCCGSRDFYIVRNHGGCPKDAGWLATTSTNCDWEKKYARTTILYSKLRTYSSFSRTGKRKLRQLVIVNLTNRQWFSVVCTLIDNDISHLGGQNFVDSRSADERVCNK